MHNALPVSYQIGLITGEPQTKSVPVLISFCKSAFKVCVRAVLRAAGKRSATSEVVQAANPAAALHSAALQYIDQLQHVGRQVI